jgi:hypothetical protein
MKKKFWGKQGKLRYGLLSHNMHFAWFLEHVRSLETSVVGCFRDNAAIHDVQWSEVYGI